MPFGLLQHEWVISRFAIDSLLIQSEVQCFFLSFHRLAQKSCIRADLNVFMWRDVIIRDVFDSCFPRQKWMGT